MNLKNHLLAVLAATFFIPGVNGQAMSATSEEQLQKEKCSKWCPRPKKDGSYIIIDANSGRIEDGGTKYPEGERLQVIFINKNPFKYSYRFNLITTPLAQSIASDFLRIIGLEPFLRFPATAKPPADIRPVEGDSKCANELRVLSDRYVNLEKESSEIQKVKEIPEKYNEFVTQTDTEVLQNCEKICQDAHILKAKLPELIEFSGRVQKFTTSVQNLKSDAEGFRVACLGQLT